MWDTEDKSIIIGGLSGQIYRWFYENPEAMPEPVFAVEGGVMNMRMRGRIIQILLASRLIMLF